MTVRKDSKPQREEPQNNLVYSVVLLFYGIGKCWFCSAPGMIAPQNKKCYITYDSKTDQYDTNEVAHGHYNGWH